MPAIGCIALDGVRGLFRPRSEPEGLWVPASAIEPLPERVTHRRHLAIWQKGRGSR